MELAAVLAILQIVVQELPGAVTTAEQLYALGQKFFATIHGREPTEAETADLRAAIDADVAAALEPLPPAESGDPDYQPPSA